MFFFFFFNDTATTEIYPLSLHDSLPIWGHNRNSLLARGYPAEQRLIWYQAKPEPRVGCRWLEDGLGDGGSGRSLPICEDGQLDGDVDRKSTRLNSSHALISYAVFCLKKKIKDKKVNFEFNSISFPLLLYFTSLYYLLSVFTL